MHQSLPINSDVKQSLNAEANCDACRLSNKQYKAKRSQKEFLFDLHNSGKQDQIEQEKQTTDRICHIICYLLCVVVIDDLSVQDQQVL